MEAALIEARERAEMIREPILAYFIEMAIAEVRARTNVSTGAEPSVAKSVRRVAASPRHGL